MSSTTDPEQRAEAAAFAADYLAIAHSIAGLGPNSTVEDADRVADEFERFYGTDPVTASMRVWQAANVGALLVAAALRKVHGAGVDGAFWALHPPATHDPANDRHIMPAMQAVTACLNDEVATANDIVSAHFKATRAVSDSDTAHEALAEIVNHHMAMLADLINAGAFEK